MFAIKDAEEFTIFFFHQLNHDKNPTIKFHNHAGCQKKSEKMVVVLKKRERESWLMRSQQRQMMGDYVH